MRSSSFSDLLQSTAIPMNNPLSPVEPPHILPRLPRHLSTNHITKKRRVPRLSSQNSLLKEGGYLLSRIALQYHRR